MVQQQHPMMGGGGEKRGLSAAMMGEFAAAGGAIHVHNYESGCIVNQVSEQQQQQQQQHMHMQRGKIAREQPPLQLFAGTPSPQLGIFGSGPAPASFQQPIAAPAMMQQQQQPAVMQQQAQQQQHQA
jgi:hypothetical protein